MPEIVKNSGNNGPPVPAEPRRRPGSRWRPLLVLVALIAAAFYVWAKTGRWPASSGASNVNQAAGRSGQGANAALTPVIAARAHRGDIGVFVTGLGSVVPVYTVTVKTRVDGQLMAVHYQEGEMVQEGASLVEIDPRPYQALLEQYEGQLKRDQALLANAKVDLARYATLVKTSAVPEQTYATQEATVAQDQGQVETDQGLIDATRLNIDYCHITSPISGRIGLRLVDPGNFVQASSGTTLLVITQVQPTTIVFPIAEDQLPQLRARMKNGEKLIVEGWDRDQQHRLATGALLTLDNQIDQTTGTVRLRAEFPNQDGSLFPNQFVYARLLLQTKHGVVLVPTAAVQRNANTTYVFVAEGDSTISIRNVELGAANGDETEVTSGVKAGDAVVLSGVDKLTEGARVAVQVQENVPPGRQAHGK